MQIFKIAQNKVCPQPNFGMFVDLTDPFDPKSVTLEGLIVNDLNILYNNCFTS